MEDFKTEEKMFELVTVNPDNFHCKPDKFICKEFIKEEKLIIPKKKPKVEQLAKIISKPIITSKKTICTPQGPKVIFQGKITQKVFYVACNPEQSVHAASFTFSFCNFIKLPNKLKIKNIKIKVEDIIVQLVDKRKINKCVLLLVCIEPEKKCSHYSN